MDGEKIAQEERDGLRSLQVITRDLPTIELQEMLESMDCTVEFTRGIMLIIKHRGML